MGELHNPANPLQLLESASRFEARIATGFCSDVKTSVRESLGKKRGGVGFHGFGMKMCQLFEMLGGVE